MYKKTPLSIEVKKVLKMLMYTLFSMLIVLSGYFFVKTSSSAEKGYELRENQLLKNSLESENRILRKRVLDAQSLNRLQNSDTVNNMNEAEDPVYVIPRGPLTQR